MPALLKSNKRKRPTINSSYVQDTSVWHSTPINSTEDVLGNRSSTTDGDASNETLISPVKRPALGNGVTSREDEVAGRSGIGTRVAVIDVDDEPNRDEEDVASDSDEYLFAEMVPTTTESTAVSRPNLDADVNLHVSERFGPVVINPPTGHSYFSSTLQKNGFLLTFPKNHLCVDASSFRETMNNWLIAHSDEESRIEDETTKFINATKKYFSTKDNLIHSCTTTLNDRECIQPSLLACLLGVKFIQVSLLDVILPFLSEATFGNGQEDIDFVSTIANQMKWLPTLVDGKTFADKLLDILDAASIPAQKHIIRLLPEIFLPEYHPYLVPKLMEIFDLGTQVNVTMLDCFSCLVTPDSECVRIRRSAVDQMTAAPLEDLPAYLSFLFRVGSPLPQLEEGIKEMREKMEIKPKFKIPKEDAFQVEILERIRFFVSVNRPIIKIWVNQVKDDLSCDSDLPVIDLIMLLTFVEAGDKSATQMLTSLFAKPVLVNDLFGKMMQNNNQMVHELFPTIARFIDTVLRIKNSKCHDAVIDITRKLFVGLGPVLSQHLTTNLIGVLINGHPSCRDVILKVFQTIAEAEAKKLLYFHSYLMGALVYVMKFPPRQMQALMNILAILAYMPENHQGSENEFTAEFMILLRKQISHSNLKTRCFGVLGTIAAVRQLAQNPNEDNGKKIDGLLALAWSSIENDEEACSIFFDELITCINMLPREVCSSFRDILKFQFERLWTLDQASDSQLLRSSRGQGDLELIPTFDANKELEREKLLIVLEPQSLEMSPSVIPSHFRVMAELEKVCEEGELEGIDAVLGCPIFFPKLAGYYEQDSLECLDFNQRYHLGHYLVLTINYFRECVSAFADSDNAELRVKVWMRLNNIITLQKALVKHYQSYPNLPSAYGTEKNMATTSGAGFSGGFGSSNLVKNKKGAGPAVKKTTKPRVARKKGKKKKNVNNEEDNSESETQQMDVDNGTEPEREAQAEKHSLNLEELIQPKFISSNIRHFDARVFSLLKYPFKPHGLPVDYTGILLNISSATQSVATMREIEQFNPEGLVLLLTEIKQQTLDRNWGFNIVINDLLVSLCNHIDAIAEFSQDEEEERSQHGSSLGSCLRLLLSVMDLYFEAVGKLEKVKRKKYMEEATLALASRYRSPSQDQDMDVDDLPSQVELLSNVSKYISNFSSFIGIEDTTAAEIHIKLMKTIHDMLPQQDQMKKAIETTIKEYLRRKWKLSSNIITFFLKTLFAVTPSPMKVIQHFVQHLMLSEDDDGEISVPSSSVYKSCSKINFHTWYAAIFSGLAQHVYKVGRRRGDFDDSIELWKEGNDLLKTLVNVSQQIKKPAILIPLIKNARVYIEAYISGGVCLLPDLLKQDVKTGQVFTKALQMSTRKIQNICEHSKVIKDNTLLRFVPQMKKVLETLLFRVREVLANVAPDAFWMGPLKHRDLDGQVISSQPFNGSVVEDSESDSGEMEVADEEEPDEEAQESDEEVHSDSS